MILNLRRAILAGAVTIAADLVEGTVEKIVTGVVTADAVVMFGLELFYVDNYYENGMHLLG